MKRLLFFIAVLFLANNIAEAAENKPRGYSLRELIDSAIENNFEINANRLNDEMTLNDVQQIARKWQPEFNTGATYSYWSWLQPSKEKMLGGGNTDMLIEVSAYQLLYDWGANKQERALSMSNISINEQLRRQIKHNIALAVTLAYLEVLNNANDIEIYETTILRLKDQLRVAENLYRIGKVTNLDLQRTKISIAVQEREITTAKTKYNERLSQLKNLAFIKQSATIEITEDAEDIYGYNITKRANSNRIEDHPLVRTFDERIEQQLAQNRFYTKQNRPTVFSYAASNWESRYIPFGDNFNYNIGIGISYRLPWGQGASYKNRIASSNIRITQLREEQSQTLTDIEREIDATSILISGKQKEIGQNEELIEMSDVTLKNAMVLYEGGEESILNLLDAQSILTEQTLIYRETIVNYLELIAKLHYLKGYDTYPLVKQ
ncbi:MAG: TolC family protein [Rikenellaceae bacterium]